jgi:hypothetical protein
MNATLAVLEAVISTADSGFDTLPVATIDTIAAIALAGALVVTVVVGVARRRAARRDLADGAWWEITPPARLAPGSPIALWQLLGGMLRRHPGPRWWPTRLAVEIVATPERVRIGLWLPPALHTAAPDQALAATLPGIQITPATGPTWPATGVSAIELMPPGGIWTPILDPTVPALLSQTTRTTDGGTEREPLRLLYALLANRTNKEQAVVQLVVRAHHSTRSHLSGTGLGGGGLLNGLARNAVLLAHAVVLLLTLLMRELLDMLTTPATRAHGDSDRRRSQLRTGARPADRVAAAHQAARDTKRADGPHLRVTLRLGIAHPSNRPSGAAARRRRLNELIGGFDLVTAPLRVRARHRHPGRLLSARPHGAWFVATASELAGLWHLPTEPFRYRLAAARARDRAPAPDLLIPTSASAADDCPRSSASRPSSAGRPIGPIASPRTDQS